MTLETDKLRFTPCLPADWDGFKIHFRFWDTIYHIAVQQAPLGNDEMSVMGVTMDGVEQADQTIHLVDDLLEHSVTVRVPRAKVSAGQELADTT